MAKKTKVQRRFEKIWLDTKRRLKELKKEATKLSKLGEREILRNSKIGKLQLDILSANLKKQALFRKLGKETAQLSSEGKIDIPQLSDLFAQISNLDAQIEQKRSQIKKLKR